MAEEGQGFLGRWARRKTDVLQGKPLAEPAAPVKPAPVASPLPVPAAPAEAPAANLESEPPERVLSLDDVKQLTRDSDFTPFMGRNVGPDVRNAAMKKLFTDPHYNVMDGLDIYIDDYSKSDPIPESMLRQMVGAKLLKIFDDEEDHEKDKDGTGRQSDAASVPADNPNNPTPETVAQSEASPDLTRPNSLSPETSSQAEPSAGSGASQDDHAHSHLRLQPDHASPAQDTGHGTQ
ncbi:MAG: DUF3306 domain-containing protein [Polaromonas sp.]